MKKEDKKDKVAKTGIIAGGVLTGTGAGLVGGNTLFAKKAATNPKLMEKLVKVAEEKGYDKMIKSNKNAGIIATAVGAPILAVSSYKHYKNKKNKKDDSAKG
jgi:hypothetical protein